MLSGISKHPCFQHVVWYYMSKHPCFQHAVWYSTYYYYRTSPRLGEIFDTISVYALWERWCRWNCHLRVINARKKGIFCCTEIVAMTPKSRDHMPITSLWGVAAKWPTRAPDETDTLPERPTRIQLYQFEPVRQDFERVPEHRVSFEANPMRYFMGFVKSHSLKCSLHKWAWCGAARKSARLNCTNLIHFRLTAGRLRGSSCIVIPWVVCELLQFAATQ